MIAIAQMHSCQRDWSLTKDTIIITKQNTPTVTVRAFLSVKYCSFDKNVYGGFLHEELKQI
jgi:hypothetical protein